MDTIPAIFTVLVLFFSGWALGAINHGKKFRQKIKSLESDLLTVEAEYYILKLKHDQENPPHVVVVSEFNMLAAITKLFSQDGTLVLNENDTETASEVISELKRRGIPNRNISVSRGKDGITIMLVKYHGEVAVWE